MEKLIEIINEIREGKGDDSVKTISSEMSLRDDLDFDSFDLAMLTAKIEDEFDIDVFEDGIVSTIGEILEKLEK